MYSEFGQVKNNIKILTFINLPKFVGGRQTSGLTLINWQVSRSINALQNEISIIIAAKDFFRETDIIDKTCILGWTPRLLIGYAFNNPLITSWYAIQSLRLQNIYGQPFFRTWAKLIFFDYSLRKVQPDIIQLRGIESAILYEFLINSRFEKIKTVLRLGGVNGFDHNITDFKMWKKIEQFIAGRKYTGILYNTHETQNQWRRYKKSVNMPSRIILNSYDNSVFCLKDSADNNLLGNNESSIIKLLTVGSIIPLKNQVNVIRAIGQLSDRRNYLYICAGYGTTEAIKHLNQEAKQNDVKLQITGFLEPYDLADVIRSSDFMILASTSEGFGNVFIESIACGTPVIIPKHLALAREQGVLSEKNSWFIENSDVQSIVKGLESIKIAKYSRSEVAATVSHLSSDIIAQQYVDFFKEIIKA